MPFLSIGNFQPIPRAWFMLRVPRRILQHSTSDDRLLALPSGDVQQDWREHVLHGVHLIVRHHVGIPIQQLDVDLRFCHKIADAYLHWPAQLFQTHRIGDLDGKQINLKVGNNDT